MKVYVVITNGKEVKGQVEGVFEEYEDANSRYKEIIEDWERWAEGDEVETDESIEHIFYCMTNFSQDEYMEVKIVERELP
jgi:hypothetical protein